MQVIEDIEHDVKFDARIQEVEHNLTGSKLTIPVNTIALRDFFVSELITDITLHYITLHYITLHYITLHYITLHYITLHYIT